MALGQQVVDGAGGGGEHGIVGQVEADAAQYLCVALGCAGGAVGEDEPGQTAGDERGGELRGAAEGSEPVVASVAQDAAPLGAVGRSY
ncbi:hypothetical protein ALMP_57330 [Streptomyces sp. A012304]|nr:hypothetical protein ALMP_57330 [Streptomyces sp. A012304]